MNEDLLIKKLVREDESFKIWRPSIQKIKKNSSGQNILSERVNPIGKSRFEIIGITTIRIVAG